MGSIPTENNINCVEIVIQNTFTVGFQCRATNFKYPRQEAAVDMSPHLEVTH